MAAKVSRGTRLSEINVTPLVDVTLVLLIIFMITAPLLQQGVDVELPKVVGRSASMAEDAIVVTVDRDSRLFVNDNLVTAGELRTKLTALFKSRANKEIFLRADQAVSYGRVMATMAVIRAAGISKLNMVTDPLNSGGRRRRKNSGQR